jgi:hypothetical protein
MDPIERYMFRMAEILSGRKLMETPEGEFYFEGETRVLNRWYEVCDKIEPVKESAKNAHCNCDIVDRARRDAMATISGI